MFTAAQRLGSLALAALFLTALSISPAAAKAVGPDFVDLAKKLKPTVVNISAAKHARQAQPQPRRPQMNPFNDQFQDFFDQFFNNKPRQREQRSLGSGFIISDDGYILTNNHVVAGMDDVKVKITIPGDHNEYKAVVKGSDEKLDLALLKIEAKEKLPFAPLGDSDRIEVGEWAMAIGNPFGLSQTVTAGIISATGRVIGSGPYDDYIQTDASINPGNSGGPLFNLNGEVIGINTAIIAGGGGGIGFAIPVNLAKGVVDQLRDKGKVTRGWMGVTIQPVTPELAKAFALDSEKGALVADVSKDSPAEKAGIRNGDIILEFNGRPIKEMNELPKTVAATAVGSKVPVKLFRDGKIETVTLTVEKLADGSDGDSVGVAGEERLGMVVSELTRELAGKLGIKETAGVVVTEVKPGGLAENVGISRGDLILEVNSVKITTVAAYDKAVTAAKKGSTMSIRLRHGNSHRYVAFTIE
jgi:serine protease Do